MSTGFNDLDGLERARRAYLGARSAMTWPRRRVVLLEVSADALVLAVGEGERCLMGCSLPLGSARIKQMLRLSPSPLPTREIVSVAQVVRSVAAATANEVNELAPRAVVLGSAPGRALWALAKRWEGRFRSWPLRRRHLVTLATELSQLDAKRLADLGVPSRGEPLEVGALVLAALTCLIATDVIWLSPGTRCPANDTVHLTLVRPMPAGV
jgi:hypothetical protein